MAFALVVWLAPFVQNPQICHQCSLQAGGAQRLPRGSCHISLLYFLHSIYHYLMLFYLKSRAGSALLPAGPSPGHALPIGAVAGRLTGQQELLGWLGPWLSHEVRM